MNRRVCREAGLLIVMSLLFASLLVANVQGGWSTVTSPTTAFLRGLFMVSGSDGWAVGDSGTIIRWNGASWSTIASPTTSTLYSVYMVSASDGWIVGGNGLIIRWNGASWSTIASPTTQWLNSVFMVSGSDGWAVGSSGTIIRWNGASWSTIASPTTSTLYSVYMVSASDGWTVGSSGTIIRWNGASWSTIASPTTVHLRDVFMVSGSDGWAVADSWVAGVSGTIIRWNGASWSTIASPATGWLAKVFMVSASDGWVAGLTTLRWNGTGWSTVANPMGGWVGSMFMVSAGNGWAVGNNGKISRWAFDAPVASFTCSPSTQEVNKAVNFDASGSSDPDGEIVSYAWTFGDGNITTTNTPIITHAYASAASYTISLRVTDNDGLTATATRQVTVTTPGAPYFSVSASPASRAINPGQSTTYSVTLTSLAGFSQSVSLSVTGLPSGATGTFNPTAVTPTGTSTLTVSTVSTTPTGTYNLTITGTGGGLTRQTTVTLEVSTKTTSTINIATSSASISVGDEIKIEGFITPPRGAVSVKLEHRLGNASGESWSTLATVTTDATGRFTYTWKPEAAGTHEIKASWGGDALTLPGESNIKTIFVQAPSGAAPLPIELLIGIVGVAIAAVVIGVVFFKLRKRPKKPPTPAQLRITAEPLSIIADGDSKSIITLQLLDKKGQPIPAIADTQVRISAPMGTLENSVVTIPKGKNTEKTVIVSSKQSGQVPVIADTDGLKSISITLNFEARKRYCMHCGSMLIARARACQNCGKTPPAGVDTKICASCNSIIPVVAKFCSECGAGQAT